MKIDGRSLGTINDISIPVLDREDSYLAEFRCSSSAYRKCDVADLDTVSRRWFRPVVLIKWFDR
jgi:hypothetical protein